MKLNRRNTLKGMAIAFAAHLQSPLLSNRGLAETFVDHEEPTFLTSCKNPDGSYSAVILSVQGHEILKITLPARGHDAAYHPGMGDCVTFARRPGKFAIAFNKKQTNTSDNTQLIIPSIGRHFYGHGVFSTNGKLLYSTENDFSTGEGIIGVRDVRDGYKQIGEFQSYGVGPHEVCLLADKRTLVVANGGIETHPESGRAKLNLATMAPNISYIDSHTGDLLEQYHLPKELHQLSIRHMTVVNDNIVAFGCQYEGPMIDQPALIGFHKRGQELDTFHAPSKIQPHLKNYIGSITTDATGSIIAASAPRGNLVTYWDTSLHRLLGHTRLNDSCGIASTKIAGQFMLTSGNGTTGIGGAKKPFEPHQTNPSHTRWDNHIRML